MTDKQPEALIWAEQLELLLPFMSPATFIASSKAIAELRRLHEVNAEMLTALYAVEVWLFSGEGTGFQDKVSAAIVKAQGDNT
jgi:hypothetical protein